MTPYDPGEVVLAGFPFEDLSSQKQRPCVVLSSAGFSERERNLVVVGLTGRPQKDEFLRVLDWESAGLSKPSWIRYRLTTVSTSIVGRRLGRLSDRDTKRILQALDSMIDERFRRGRDTSVGA